MINLTDEEKEFLKKHMSNADELMSCDDVNIILDKIDDLIMELGHDENQDITDVGRRIEKMYDNIYANN